MTQKEFDEVRNRLLDKAFAEAGRKRPDYAEVQEGKNDVLANFKEVGARTGMTPLQCAMVYFEKHLVTLEKYCRGLALKSEPIEGRMIDLLNYLTLIYGIIEEERAVPAEIPVVVLRPSASLSNATIVEHPASPPPTTVGPVGLAPKSAVQRALDSLSNFFTPNNDYTQTP